MRLLETLMVVTSTALVGCGGGEEGARARGGGAGGGSAGAAGGGGFGGCGIPAPSGVLGDVAGTWAYREAAARIAVVPAFPEPIANQTVSVMRFEITVSSGRVSVDVEYCDHRVEDPGAIVRTVITDAYRRALRPFHREGTFDEGADGLPRLDLPAHYEVVGATLADVGNEVLPTDPTDPRVSDDDGDGKPGVTIQLTGVVTGEIYVVKRRWTAFAGTPDASGRIEGLLDFGPEEVILASDPASLEDLSPTSSRDPDPCRSTFSMVRVADDTDCADIRSRAEELFP